MARRKASLYWCSAGEASAPNVCRLLLLLEAEEVGVRGDWIGDEADMVGDCSVSCTGMWIDRWVDCCCENRYVETTKSSQARRGWDWRLLVARPRPLWVGDSRVVGLLGWRLGVRLKNLPGGRRSLTRAMLADPEVDGREHELRQWLSGGRSRCRWKVGESDKGGL